MMHRNALWIAFLAIIGISVLVYTGLTLVKLYDYSRLNTEVNIHEVHWSIKYYAVDSNSPQADYTFTFERKPYKGQTIFSERYLNHWAATEAIHKMHPKTVWINPSHPQDSTLEKIFPLKSTIYTLLLWGLLIYFILLGRRIANYG